MGKTNSLIDKLNSQVSNLVRFPNIQSNTFDSLQRYLLRYWQRTYGVNYIGTVQNVSPGITSGGATNQLDITSKTFSQDFLNAPVTGGLGSILNTQAIATSYTSSSTRFLVIAVHGVKADTGLNVGATANNIIYIANHVHNFPPGTSLTLNTPKNAGIPVTVKGYKGNGVMQVNEDLVLDVMTINVGGTDYEKNSGSFPYVEYSKTLTM